MKKILGLRLDWYKGQSFMWNVVQFIINNGLINHKGKFKEGDKVRYNWMAKIQLGKDYLNGEGVKNKTLEVTHVLYKSKSNVNYKVVGSDNNDDGGCATFWLRKAYWWEI
jgi:hypothetical protein